MKTKTAIIGKPAKAKPDYPARQLRRLVRMLQEPTHHIAIRENDIFKLIANIKKRMGWK